MHFGSAPYNAGTLFGELRLLFFYCTVRYFPTMNSVMHALRVATSACSFLLYRELFSDRELFTNHELCDAHTSAPPHVTHALYVASPARSFSIVL